MVPDINTIEIGPAGQDGTPFNADETRQLWEAIDRASDGEKTGLTISGQLVATINPAYEGE
jgi:hypothetical protein